MEMNYTSLQYRFYKVVKYTYKHEVYDTCPIQCPGHDNHDSGQTVIISKARALCYHIPTLNLWSFLDLVGLY